MVNNIDKIAPAKPTASADITTETSGNVTVTAVFSGDSAKKEFSLAGLVWQDYTAPLVFTENGRAYFRGTDAAGNASDIISYEVRNIQAATPDNALDDGRNDELYDKKAKAFCVEDEDHHFETTGIGGAGINVQLDNDPVKADGYRNYVGYGDKTDYAKIELSKGAALSFSIDSTGDATFTVYRKGQDKKGNDTLEAIQTTKLKLDKGASVVDKFTDAISGLAAGEYYISMTATNTSNNAKGSVFYNVTATFEPSDMASLAMPETSDSLAMTDSLSFGTFDTDVIASATSSSLAELDDKSVWQNLSLA